MLKKLRADQYVKLVPLFENYGPNQTVIDACLNARNPCEIWVDEKNPKENLALISKYGFAFGWGNIESTLEHVANDQKKEITFIPKNYSTPEFGTLTERWEFKDYEERAFIQKLLDEVPPHLSWVPITEKNAKQSNWADTILTLFDNYASFERSGGGLALSDGKKFLSECIIGFLGNDHVEIGTVTHPEYRGKGYSTIVCAQLMKKLLEKNFKPYWSCSNDNPASICVAEKLGFNDSKRYAASKISPK